MSEEKEVTYNSVGEIPSDKIDEAYVGVCALLEKFKFESEGYRSIEDIFRAVGKSVLQTLGTMVTIWTASKISTSTLDEDIYGNILKEFEEKLAQYPTKIGTLINVTLARKIYVNQRYATKACNEKLLKTLLVEGDRESLSYIWFHTYRNKRIEEIKGI